MSAVEQLVKHNLLAHCNELNDFWGNTKELTKKGHKEYQPDLRHFWFKRALAYRLCCNLLQFWKTNHCNKLKWTEYILYIYIYIFITNTSDLDRNKYYDDSLKLRKYQQFVAQIFENFSLILGVLKRGGEGPIKGMYCFCHPALVFPDLHRKVPCHPHLSVRRSDSLFWLLQQLQPHDTQNTTQIKMNRKM